MNLIVENYFYFLIGLAVFLSYVLGRGQGFYDGFSDAEKQFVGIPAYEIYRESMKMVHEEIHELFSDEFTKQQKLEYFKNEQCQLNELARNGGEVTKEWAAQEIARLQKEKEHFIKENGLPLPSTELNKMTRSISKAIEENLRSLKMAVNGAQHV